MEDFSLEDGWKNLWKRVKVTSFFPYKLITVISFQIIYVSLKESSSSLSEYSDFPWYKVTWITSECELEACTTKVKCERYREKDLGICFSGLDKEKLQILISLYHSDKKDWKPGVVFDGADPCNYAIRMMSLEKNGKLNRPYSWRLKETC